MCRAVQCSVSTPEACFAGHATQGAQRACRAALSMPGTSHHAQALLRPSLILSPIRLLERLGVTARGCTLPSTCGLHRTV